jgi:hypothetical protein
LLILGPDKGEAVLVRKEKFRFQDKKSGARGSAVFFENDDVLTLQKLGAGV